MIFYLLLIAVFGILILAAIAVFIFGLLKKRKQLLITAVVLLIAGTIGCVFSAIVYTKKAIDYVRSDTFQEDAKKGSAFVGKTAGSIASGVSNGLASTLDDEAIEKLASKSGIILGKSIKTIASGLDSTLGNKTVFLDKTLENSGIELGRAEAKASSNTNDLDLFITYNKDFKGNIRMTNYDQNGRKIETADKKIYAHAGQEQVETFSFSHSDLRMTTYYVVANGD